jgi:hypothetical protein
MRSSVNTSRLRLMQELSTQASVYTQGEVSLAMTGSGRGVNIGIDFGKLEISKRAK